jgi:hypothetical protein
VNYRLEPVRVYNVNELEYIEGKPEGFLETTVQHFTVGQCDGFSGLIGAITKAPPGQKKWEIKGKEPMVVVKDGYIVAARGHIHG